MRRLALPVPRGGWLVGVCSGGHGLRRTRAEVVAHGWNIDEEPGGRIWC